MAELKYWLWLQGRHGIGQAKLGMLLRHFGSPENIYFARDSEYEGVIEGDLSSLRDKSLEDARRIIRSLDECRASAITLGDAQYPVRLKNIFDPPVVLYVKGRLPLMDEEAAVAIVGTRKCSAYGLVTAERMAYDIAKSGGVIVTGLARGIDSAAARGAIRAGGKVVGVLGCGIDVVYPRENRPLFDDVETVGAIISEYPPGAEPNARNFPARNRIMSGISVGTVVVEAPLKSGALITASHALEQGRDVFTVPGNVDADASRGTNALLRDGAIPVTRGEDIVEEYRPLFPDKLNKRSDNRALDPEIRDKLVTRELAAVKRKDKKTRSTAPKEEIMPKKGIDNGKNEDYIDLTLNTDDLTDEERTVLSAIKESHTHVDDIIEASGLPAAAVLSTLTLLELDGAVTQETGKRFTANIKL